MRQTKSWRWWNARISRQEHNAVCPQSHDARTGRGGRNRTTRALQWRGPRKTQWWVKEKSSPADQLQRYLRYSPSPEATRIGEAQPSHSRQGTKCAQRDYCRPWSNEMWLMIYLFDSVSLTICLYILISVHHCLCVNLIMDGPTYRLILKHKFLLHYYKTPLGSQSICECKSQGGKQTLGARGSNNCGNSKICWSAEKRSTLTASCGVGKSNRTE